MYVMKRILFYFVIYNVASWVSSGLAFGLLSLEGNAPDAGLAMYLLVGYVFALGLGVIMVIAYLIAIGIEKLSEYLS